MKENKEKLRLDKYLWAIRVFKTRTQAAEACDKGKVKLNEESVKASRAVKAGDIYDIRTPARRWKIVVVDLLYNRVQYIDAIKYYTDITPEEEKVMPQFQAASFHTGKRLSKVGRPTKKDRRDIEGFTGD